MNLSEFLALLPDARKNCNGYVARCPAHEDRKPSLAIGAGDDGCVLVKCMAGCETAAVLDAMGLRMADLYPAEKGYQNSGNLKARVVARYDYVDEQGKLLFQVERKADKQFLQRRPDGNGGWIYKLNGTRRVPYRLPELLAADAGQWVFCPEGEKDVDNLRALGLVATCNPGGAGKWRPEYGDALRGRRVCIIADNDDAGEKHAQQVLADLTGKAADVRVLRLPNLPPKGDVSDWLDARDGAEPEALAAQLVELAEKAPTSAPLVENAIPASRDRETAGIEFLDPVPLSALGPDEPVDWIWEPYLARGCTGLFSALWKCGKTTLLGHLFKSMGTGGHLVGCVHPGRVLIISEEPARHWRSRRDELGIGDHVEIITRPFKSRPNAAIWRLYIEHIARHCRERSYQLVVIDTFANISPCADENDSVKVMEALLPLASITETGAALLLVHHFRKSDGQEAQASRGSGALGGYVDTIMELRRFLPNQRDDPRRVLTAYSRFGETPAEVVLELTAGGYVTQGTRSDAGKKDRASTIRGILPDGGPGMTTEEILAAWPDEIVKPGIRTARIDLAAGAQAGAWGQTGTGKKGDPHRYHRGQNAIPATSGSIGPESNSADGYLPNLTPEEVQA